MPQQSYDVHISYISLAWGLGCTTLSVPDSHLISRAKQGLTWFVFEWETTRVL